MLGSSSTEKRSFLIVVSLALLIGFLLGRLIKEEYWSGVYYPEGSISGSAIYSPKFDSKEECIGWAINERGKRPQDGDVPLQDLWECNKNCRLESSYEYLVRNNQSSILERNVGPLYLCDDGGFDGGDWLRGDF